MQPLTVRWDPFQQFYLESQLSDITNSLNQWAERNENAGNALMTSQNVPASSCDLPSQEDTENKTHSLLKGRMLPSYQRSTFCCFLWQLAYITTPAWCVTETNSQVEGQ